MLHDLEQRHPVFRLLLKQLGDEISGAWNQSERLKKLLLTRSPKNCTRQCLDFTPVKSDMMLAKIQSGSF